MTRRPLIRWEAPLLEVDWGAIGTAIYVGPLFVAAVASKRLRCCRLHLWIELQVRRERSMLRFLEQLRPMPHEWKDFTKRRLFDSAREACWQGIMRPRHRAACLAWLVVIATGLLAYMLWITAAGGAS